MSDFAKKVSFIIPFLPWNISDTIDNAGPNPFNNNYQKAMAGPPSLTSRKVAKKLIPISFMAEAEGSGKGKAPEYVPILGKGVGVGTGTSTNQETITSALTSSGEDS